MQLIDRLQLLKDACRISEETYEAMLKCVDSLDETFGLRVTEENGSMFITHLAIAYERVSRNEAINAMGDAMQEEVRFNKNYDKSLKILNELEQHLKGCMPENEKPYILLYLCLLLDKQ